MNRVHLIQPSTRQSTALIPQEFPLDAADAGEGAQPRPKCRLGPAVVEGTDVTDASAGTRTGTGEWIVQLDFNSKGSSAWAAYPAAVLAGSRERARLRLNGSDFIPVHAKYAMNRGHSK